jgi:hypothetical protein
MTPAAWRSRTAHELDPWGVWVPVTMMCVVVGLILRNSRLSGFFTTCLYRHIAERLSRLEVGRRKDDEGWLLACMRNTTTVYSCYSSERGLQGLTDLEYTKFRFSWLCIGEIFSEQSIFYSPKTPTGMFHPTLVPAIPKAPIAERYITDMKTSSYISELPATST